MKRKTETQTEQQLQNAPIMAQLHEKTAPLCGALTVVLAGSRKSFTQLRSVSRATRLIYRAQRVSPAGRPPT